MDTLAKILKNIFSEPELYAHYLEAKILTMYPKSVGEKIAQVSTAQSFRDGILYVKVNSASWRNELNLMSLQIKDAINKDLGEQLINKVVFR